jgi:P pilus assembly chaperone PapD
MNVLRSILLTTTIMSIGLSFAQAGVVIGGTRVIFDGNKKEASISINNPDNTPILSSHGLKRLGAGEKAPFIITPPLYRLNNGQQNVERIVATGLPQDKESLFWLNIKAIPSASQVDNTLQIAIKTRIKLIYRPATMKGASLKNRPINYAGNALGIKYR